ncbi:MAG TPA: hypothetical protein VGO21_04380 [Candidatus Paceibacterota bacterium]|jgi:hypothetical protein|nr:hypothetical protein [Candidatus Paceibacterota bacterium]
MRIFECETVDDVKQFFLKIRNMYQQQPGEEHKISFGMLAGHSSWEGIILGNDSDGTFSENHIRFMEGYFRTGATFILNSCRTGITNGIGQKLSGKLGLTVIAPEEDTYMRDIRVRHDKRAKTLSFEVEYAKKNEQAIYKNGVRITA